MAVPWRNVGDMPTEFGMPITIVATPDPSAAFILAQYIGILIWIHAAFAPNLRDEIFAELHRGFRLVGKEPIGSN